MSRIKDNFTDSLIKWTEFEDKLKSGGDTKDYLCSVDEYIEAFDFGQNEQQNLIFAALKPIVNQRLHSVYADLECAIGRCQSPIEASILAALFIVGTEVCGDIKVVYYPYNYSPLSFDTLYIEPQCPIGKYKVDFLLTLSEIGPDFSRKQILRNGEETYANMEIVSRLILECDGHDFHDRTKEQAQRDKERDRHLQMVGFPVHRFTGSEIWKDVFGCAHQAVKAMKVDITRKLWGDEAAEEIINNSRK